jgi:hypothetical protein
MTPEELTRIELGNSSERSLRGELSLHNLYPSDIIGKSILINMLMNVYFGGENHHGEQTR